MSGWIKFDKDMADDPRLLQAAAQLGKRYVLARVTPGGGADLSPAERLAFASNAVTGALVTLWRYADIHIRDDDTLPMTRETLNAMVGIDDFFEIMPRDWINELDDGTVVLPSYCKKNSLIAKRKAAIKSNARVTAFRARKKISGNAHVTHGNTRYTRVSKVVDQDQDQDLKKTPLPPLHDSLPVKQWEEWLAWRKGKRMPCDSLTLAKQLAILAKLSTAEQIETIEKSIQAGWQGLFPEKPKSNGKHFAAAPDNSAAWAEARTRAAAIGFRPPHPQESVSAYMTDIKLAESAPRSGPKSIAALAEKMRIQA